MWFLTAIATPINTTSLSQSSSDSTPSSRPSYPRTQYNMARAHVTVDSSLSNPPSENPYALHPPGWIESNVRYRYNLKIGVFFFIVEVSVNLHQWQLTSPPVRSTPPAWGCSRSLKGVNGSKLRAIL
jgi:hypothetical protein